MNQIHLYLLAFTSLSAMAAEPAKIIFDTDMASDCDDAGALAVLHGLADLGEAEILAITTNRKDPSNASAAAADAINTYYGRPDIPIGTDKDGHKRPRNGESAYVRALGQEFSHDAKPDDQMPDALSVYRKALASQPDGSVVICSVGALSNLEDLIRSLPDNISPLSGKELIEKKVKSTVIMGGGFPRTNKPETNIILDPAAAVTVANEWPGPILWQGYEVGAAIHNGTELQSTPKSNPVRRAYELRPYHGKPSLEISKPSHDHATVLIAVRGAQSEYWRVIKDGRAIISSDGATHWEKLNGKPRVDWQQHRYVAIKGHPSTLQKLIGDLMSAAPKN